MHFRNMSPSTTCLYSAAFILLRSLSAPKPEFGFEAEVGTVGILLIRAFFIHGMAGIWIRVERLSRFRVVTSIGSLATIEVVLNWARGRVGGDHHFKIGPEVRSSRSDLA